MSERSLVSAPIAVPAREAQPRLRFSMWHLFSGISLCFDGGILEVQPQSSGSWSAVGSGALSVPYDAQVNNAYDNPRGGQPAWCFDRAWSPVEVDLSSWAGQEVRLRWRLTTDRTEGTAEGWYVDDVHLRQMVCP